MPDDDEPFQHESSEFPITCRHLLLCKTAWYDPTKSEEFSLGRVIVHLFSDDGSFPTVFDRLFLYGQLFGTPGEYRVRIRLVRIEQEGYDEEVEVELEFKGKPSEWGPNRPLVVSDEAYVEQFAVPLISLYIPAAGLYEIQLLLEGYSEPIGRERFSAREKS